MHSGSRQARKFRRGVKLLRPGDATARTWTAALATRRCLLAVAERDMGFRTLYERHAGWLAIRLARRCNGLDLVADAIQDTFVAIWQRPQGFRGDGDIAARPNRAGKPNLGNLHFISRVPSRGQRRRHQCAAAAGWLRFRGYAGCLDHHFRSGQQG